MLASATETQPTALDLVTEAQLAALMPRMHMIAKRMLGCDHLAADAVQEGLVALWRETEAPEHLAAWLGRTIIHRCRHLRRTAMRRHHHEHIASAHCNLHKGCDNPLHIAIAHETSEQLAAVVDTLPAEQRTALLLYERTGLDYQGIATQLDLPIGTVRSRLARARGTLQAAVHRYLSSQ